MNKFFLLLFILLFPLYSNSQSNNIDNKLTWEKVIYSVSINKTIDSCIGLNVKDSISTPLTKLYNGHFYIKMYENGKLLEVNGILRNGFPLQCFAWLQDDTLCIGGSYGFKGGFGFVIKINNDLFSSFYSPYSDVAMYKLNKSDSVMQKDIDVPAVKQKVILTQIPILEKGQRVKGYLELKSNDFLEYDSVRPNTYSVELKVYFSCEISDY